MCRWVVKLHWQISFPAAEVEDFGFSQALPESEFLAHSHTPLHVQVSATKEPFLMTKNYVDQILLLQRACDDLEKEKLEREEEKVRYLGDKLPPLQLSGMSLNDLQVRVVDDGNPPFKNNRSVFICLKYFC